MEEETLGSVVVTFLKKAYFKFLDISQTILFGASFLLILYIFVIQPHQISGSSMYPTFEDQELLMSYLLDVNFHNLRRGDVVVFHAPPPDVDKLYIKRIIGMPGDSVRVQDGAVYLNNEKLDESGYLKPDVATFGGGELRDGETLVVPENHLFVMGDNRPYSSDSRAFGVIPYSKLIGRSMFRFWPTSKFTFVPRDPYKK